MSTAARPRPRPRPRISNDAAEVSSSTSATDSKPSSSTTSVPDSSRTEEEDLDSMFTKRRSVSAWKNVEKKFQRPSVPRQSSQGADSERFSSEEIKSPKARHKNTKIQPLPAWTNANSIAVLQISSDEEEDNDDDENALRDASNTSGRISKGSPKGKRKRERSRSPTPPPPLPEHQLQNARQLVRRALNTQNRPLSPTFSRDDYTESISAPLNPELARIAAQIQSKGVTTDRIQSQRSGGEPPAVTITVKWKKHPQNPVETSWTRSYQVKRNDEFRDLFEDIADEAGIRTAYLYVSHDAKRIFQVATPEALHIWSAAEFEACHTNTHEYLLQHKNEPARSAQADDLDDNDNSFAAVSQGTGHPLQARHGSQSDEGTFKITIRSTAAKEITVTVRPTTTCGAIVENFIKRAGLKPSKKARLQIDGESMKPDVTIAETDLEDGDMVDIVGI